MDDISQVSANMSIGKTPGQAFPAFETSVPATNTTMPLLIIAFQTDRDSPNIQIEALVQDTAFVFFSVSRRLLMFVVSREPEHPFGPSHHANSTPAWKTPSPAEITKASITVHSSGRYETANSFVLEKSAANANRAHMT